MPAIRPFLVLAAVALLAGCGLGPGPVPWPGEGDRANLVEQGISSTPDQFILGHEATVHVTVANVGKVAARGFDVEFAVTPHGTRFAWPREHVAGLAAGATTVVDFVVEVTSSEDIPIEIVVDPGNAVPESSETDNTTHHVATVSSDAG